MFVVICYVHFFIRKSFVCYPINFFLRKMSNPSLLQLFLCHLAQV